MTMIRNVLHRTVAAVARRRLARVLVVAVVAAAGVLTMSAAASAAGANSYNEIHSAGTNKCLDVTAEDNHYKVGARVQQYHCTGVKEQKWQVRQINSIDGFNPTWIVVNQRSGRASVEGRSPLTASRPSR